MILLFRKSIASLFNIHSINQFMLLIPVVILSAGILQTIEQWLIRKNQFQISAKANLLETVFINSGKLVIGLLYSKASVLIFFTTIRQGIKAYFMYRFSSDKNIKYFFNLKLVNYKYLVNIGKKYKDFPLYRTPEIVLSAVSASTPILLLTSFFGPTAAGFYSIARTVLAVPTSLVAQSVGSVFYPRVSQAANNNEKVKPMIIKSTFYLFLIGLVPYGLVIMIGPWLFSLVFGSDWIIAGQYARWVALSSFLNFVNKPVVQSLPVIHAQKFQLLFTFIKFIITSLALLIGFFVFSSDMIAIALFTILETICFIVLTIITIYKSKKFDESNVK